MISSIFLTLLLALTVQSWPQMSFPDDLDGDISVAMVMPVIPYTPIPEKRSLPVVEDGDSRVTLPILQDKKRNLPATDNSEGTFTLPVIHVKKRGLVSRAVDLKLENRSDVAYYAQISIGTPPQTVYAQLDTGSFELWVNPQCSGLPLADQSFCTSVGSYNPNDSSTAVDLHTTNLLRYGIGAAEITYYTDDISLSSNATIKGAQFGVANETEDEFSGILGIGYGENYTIPYKNVIDQLADQGVTKGRLFSLGLGSKFEEEGAITFGGIDKGKFAGGLASLPIISAADSPDKVARYWISMKSISLTPPTGVTKTWANSSMPVFLDSGATLSLLPPTLVKSIAENFGAVDMDANGFYIVDCSIADMNGTVNFAFDGVTIKVPYDEIIREVASSPPQCYLGIVPSDEFTLLGDTFLRSAYVVFDLDSHTIYMAPYSNCGTNISTVDATSDLTNVEGDCTDDGKELAVDVSSSTTTISAVSATTMSTVAASATGLVDGAGTQGNGALGRATPSRYTCLTMSFGLMAALLL